MRTTTVPRGITRTDAGLDVDWDGRGHSATFPARALRLACPCAMCVDELSGRALLDPATVPPDVRPLAVSLVGAYGVRIDWSDGHGTGIYTWDALARACPCPACAAARAG